MHSISALIAHFCYDSGMNEVILKTNTFDVEVPEKPFVGREDGGHIRIMSRIKVKDRTELNTEQTIEYALLTALVGKALERGMTQRGIEIGNINWQEMGNWSVFKPEGITLHMHIFGRAKDAKVQKYGEAVQLPFRDTGFYDDFEKLNPEDVLSVSQQIEQLLATDQYAQLQDLIIS